MPVKGKYHQREKAYHPRRKPGRCAICGSTRHYTSQCTRPVKPKAKNAEWDEATSQQDEVEWQESTWETEEHEASKGKKAKVRDQSPRVNLQARVHRDRLHPDQRSLNLPEETDPNPKPNPKHVLAWQMTSSSPWCLESLSQHRDILIGMAQTTWSAQLLNLKRSCQSSSPASGHCFQIAESPSMDMMPRAWRTSHCTSTWPSSVIV